MSGSTGLPSGAFSDAEKADIRRFCGYPVYGTDYASNAGYRFFQWYGALEYRMNNMRPEEYQVARQYLGWLYTLEAAIPNASATLNVDTAAAFVRNKNEMRDRESAYRMMRLKLCAFMGVPPGDQDNLLKPGLSFVV